MNLENKVDFVLPGRVDFKVRIREKYQRGLTYTCGSCGTKQFIEMLTNPEIIAVCRKCGIKNKIVYGL